MVAPDISRFLGVGCALASGLLLAGISLCRPEIGDSELGCVPLSESESSIMMTICSVGRLTRGFARRSESESSMTTTGMGTSSLLAMMMGTGASRTSSYAISPPYILAFWTVRLQGSWYRAYG